MFASWKPTGWKHNACVISGWNAISSTGLNSVYNVVHSVTRLTCCSTLWVLKRHHTGICNVWMLFIPMNASFCKLHIANEHLKKKKKDSNTAWNWLTLQQVVWLYILSLRSRWLHATKKDHLKIFLWSAASLQSKRAHAFVCAKNKKNEVMFAHLAEGRVLLTCGHELLQIGWC